MGIAQIRQCNVSNINHQTLTRIQRPNLEFGDFASHTESRSNSVDEDDDVIPSGSWMTTNAHDRG